MPMAADWSIPRRAEAVQQRRDEIAAPGNATEEPPLDRPRAASATAWQSNFYATGTDGQPDGTAHSGYPLEVHVQPTLEVILLESSRSM
jgi:hypothetical protein